MGAHWRCTTRALMHITVIHVRVVYAAGRNRRRGLVREETYRWTGRGRRATRTIHRGPLRFRFGDLVCFFPTGFERKPYTRSTDPFAPRSRASRGDGRQKRTNNYYYCSAIFRDRDGTSATDMPTTIMTISMRSNVRVSKIRVRMTFSCSSCRYWLIIDVKTSIEKTKMSV